MGFTKRIRVVTACLVLAIVAAAVPSLARGTSATESGRTYSGETLFRGIFFGQGPVAREVADLFPGLEQAIASLPDSEKAELAEFRDRIIGHIRAAHPEFFPSFGRQVQSGDHLVIDAALARGGEHLFEAYEREFGTGFLERLGEGESLGRGKGLHLVGVGLVGVIVGVVVVLVVTAETGVLVHFIANVWDVTRCRTCSEFDKTRLSLLREMLVDRIATSLSAAR